ncbi:hypothetical protein WH52_07075 [Tenacibaculum holothuriorum]|uniref:Outer membrane insertion C-signal n=1 Tax=Tenacibaculum holothuriorum TaxID=1635173 RepID=A0A1Y2PFC8_9FLAO|nr:hypothetical protein [Tenacibaculum holothuriorum]OSY88507.1 hypothetical protein WH52_07075 [Tenacibaculum holothuriorum]
MKKVFLTIGLFLAVFLTANAQEISENAIGIRFGDNNGFGGEISYQRKLSDNNRLEVDLGLRKGSAFKATGLYQWVWQLENQFNWYAGVGGGIASGSGSTALFGAGVIGIEYNFDIPLMISLDFRPEIGFNDFYDGFQSDFGLGVRYQF